MSALELLAAALGIVCVALAVRRSVCNYPFGIASVALYFAVFGRAKLYSDALLQLFFIVVNAGGWWAWSRNRAGAGEVIVEAMTTRDRWRWVAGCVAATLAWGALMHRYTDASYPWPDAGVAITSVAAQWLMARRKWENWLLWIAVDLASIPLYALKQLGATTLLYLLYLAMAVWGLVDWTRIHRRATGPAAL